MEGELAVDARQKSARKGYFFLVSAILLAFTVAGFMPSFFLRPLFDPKPLPFYFHVHGAVLTGWFVWLTLQAWLVRSGQTPVHRRMGWIGAGIAVAVVLATVYIPFDIAARKFAEA